MFNVTSFAVGCVTFPVVVFLGSFASSLDPWFGINVEGSFGKGGGGKEVDPTSLPKLGVFGASVASPPLVACFATFNSFSNFLCSLFWRAATSVASSLVCISVQTVSMNLRNSVPSSMVSASNS